MEDKLKNVHDSNGGNNVSWTSVEDLCIKVEDGIVKQEQCQFDEEYIENELTVEELKTEVWDEIESEYVDIKLEDNNRSYVTEGETVFKQNHECLYCDFETSNESSLKYHIVTFHEDILLDSDENLMIKSDLDVHQMTHHTETRIFKCHTCNFETRHRHGFTDHLLTHKDPPKLKVYKCDECDYQTNKKTHFKSHQTEHEIIFEEQMHKCPYCEHRTKRKFLLRGHLIFSHRNILADPKENLKVKGILNLKKTLNLSSYECDKCSFKTGRKNVFTIHKLSHNNSSKVRMYKCAQCDFATKYLNCLKNHQSWHLV